MAQRQTATPATPTTITKFDGDAIDVLRQVIDKALHDALAPFGLSAKLGRITYNESSFSGKLEVVTANDGERNYQQLVQLYPGALKAEWFGQTFTSKGEQYRIVGADLGRSKFDVATVRECDSKPFGFTHDGIFHAFNPEGAEKAKRAEYERNLRIHATAPHNYPAINASLLGVELVTGGKVIGLSDMWPSSRTRVIVERKDGTLGAIRVKDFDSTWIKSKTEPKPEAA